MRTVTVSEAKASLSKLLQRVLEGEEIAIGRRGRPEVVLRRIDQDAAPRLLGGFEDGYWMSDDFDAPVSGIERAFAGLDDDSDGADAAT